MATKVHHYLNPVHLARKKKKQYDTLAYVVIGITFFITIPQVIQIYQTESAEDIAIVSWIGYSFIAIFWLIYGIERQIHPIIFSSLLHLIVDIAIVYGIIQYGNVL